MPETPNHLTFSLVLVQKDASAAITDMKQISDYGLVRARAAGKLGEKDSPYKLALIISDSLVVEVLHRQMYGIVTQI